MKEKDGHFFKFSGKRRAWEGRKLHDDCFEYLLCRECEHRLGRWESAVARRIHGGIFDQLIPQSGKKTVTLNVGDYRSTRLYCLSLLWRVSVATNEQFSQVKLGQNHETKLAKMLLDEEPGEPWEYGCQLSVPFFETDNETIHRAPIGYMPETLRWPHDKGLRLVRMLVDGLLLHFMIGSDECMRTFRGVPMFLQKNGSWMVGVTNALNVTFMRDLFVDIHRAENPS